MAFEQSDFEMWKRFHFYKPIYNWMGSRHLWDLKQSSALTSRFHQSWKPFFDREPINLPKTQLKKVTASLSTYWYHNFHEKHVYMWYSVVKLVSDCCDDSMNMTLTCGGFCCLACCSLQILLFLLTVWRPRCCCLYLSQLLFLEQNSQNSSPTN